MSEISADFEGGIGMALGISCSFYEVRGRSGLPAFRPEVIAVCRYFGWFTGFQSGHKCWTPVVWPFYRLSALTKKLYAGTNPNKSPGRGVQGFYVAYIFFNSSDCVLYKW